MREGIPREKLLQALKDCGCDEPTIADFLTKADCGQRQEALAILTQHRKDLLDQFHRCDGCICRLDYVIDQIKRNQP